MHVKFNLCYTINLIFEPGLSENEFISIEMLCRNNFLTHEGEYPGKVGGGSAVGKNGRDQLDQIIGRRQIFGTQIRATL